MTGGAVRFLARALAGLLAVQVLLALLLVLAHAVPDDPIIAQLDRAVREGTYGPGSVPSGFGGTADRAGECVLLGHGVSSADDPRGLWHRAAGGVGLEPCELGAGQVRALAAGESVHPPAVHVRSWNGYSVLTRPVLAAVGVTGVRLVVAGLLVLATTAAVLVVRRRAGLGPALALVVPMAVATDAVSTPATASGQGIALAAVAAGVALTAVLTGSGAPGGAPAWRGAVVGAGAGAVLVGYLDPAAAPAVSWALCAAVAGAVASAAAAGVRATAVTVAAAALAWPVAHGTTVVSRWVLAALVQGPGVLARLSDVDPRAAGDQAAGSRPASDQPAVVHGLGAPLRAGTATWLETTATAVPLLVVAAGVVAVALVLAVVRRGPLALARAAVVAAPALVVPLWFEVVGDHGRVHALSADRSLPAAVGVVVMAALVAAGSRRRAVRAVARPYDTRTAGRSQGPAGRRRAHARV